MGSPRATAVITSYNYGHFIQEAVESVLTQDFPRADLEVVVVDDGSTDDTPERMREFGDRVIYIRKPNGGQASALNAGFARARGEIVALLDADDVWLPNKLRRVCKAFELHPEAVMVQHTRLLWNSATGALEREPQPPRLSGSVPPLPNDLLRYGPNATSALAFRKALLGGLVPVPEILTGHADSFLSALAVLVAPVVSIDEPLAKYRIHGQNLFTFEETEEKRVTRRLEQLQTLVRELERELQARRQTFSGAGIEAYLMRFRLIEENLRFASQSPSRREFFRHLRTHAKVYGPLWPARYRMLRSATSVAGLLLGYRRFEAARAFYRRSGLRERREAWFPAMLSESRPCGTQKAIS